MNQKVGVPEIQGMNIKGQAHGRASIAAIVQAPGRCDTTTAAVITAGIANHSGHGKTVKGTNRTMICGG